MGLSLSLFPFRIKFLGLVLMILALPFAYLYFWGGKPEIFNIKIFAVITSYSETKYFVVSQTNALDELAAIFFISGMTLFSFSKEKIEKEHYELLRTKALINALYSTILLWLLSFIFIYGKIIFLISFLIFLIFLFIYNLFFRYYLLQSRKSEIKS
jgi:hypothetical protein